MSISPARSRARRTFNLPNLLTFGRVLIVPMVVACLFWPDEYSLRWTALALFTAAAVTDFFDGYLARIWDQQSALGRMLDPIADKLLLISAIVVLSFDHRPHLGQLPLWLTGTIIGRDVLLVLGVVTVRLVVGHVTVHPRITGKIATVFQMLAVCWLLLRWDQSQHAQQLQVMKLWFLGAGIFTAISGLLYVWDGTQQLSSHPSSSATPK